MTTATANVSSPRGRHAATAAAQAARLDESFRAGGATVGEAEGRGCLAVAPPPLIGGGADAGGGRVGVVALEADGQLLAAVLHTLDLK